jgi:hypothetical protein
VGKIGWQPTRAAGLHTTACCSFNKTPAAAGMKTCAHALPAPHHQHSMRCFLHFAECADCQHVLNRHTKGFTTISALVTHATQHTVHRASQPRTPAVAAVTLFIRQTGVQDKDRHALHILAPGSRAGKQCLIQHIFLSKLATGQHMKQEAGHVAADSIAACRRQSISSTHARTACDMTSWL